MEELSRLERTVSEKLTEILVAQARTDGKVDSLTEKYASLAKSVQTVVVAAVENKINIVKILAWGGVGGASGGGLLVFLLNYIEKLSP